jgi:hypothetical protein
MVIHTARAIWAAVAAMAWEALDHNLSTIRLLCVHTRHRGPRGDCGFEVDIGLRTKKATYVLTSCT